VQTAANSAAASLGGAPALPTVGFALPSSEAVVGQVVADGDNPRRQQFARLASRALMEAFVPLQRIPLLGSVIPTRIELITGKALLTRYQKLAQCFYNGAAINAE
jgi:hypothetical protein